MKENEVFLLAKFGKEEHIRQLVSDGLIYMNRLSFFQQMEDGNFRGDKNENKTRMIQPENIKVSINGHEITNLVGPVTRYLPSEDRDKITHVFCMSCLWTDLTVRTDFHIFDPKVMEFEGADTLAIIPVTGLKQFNERLKATLDLLCEKDEILSGCSKRVKYIPSSTYTGPMNAFVKTNDYDWQNEFRIGVSAPHHAGALQIKMGNLTDICHTVKLVDFKNLVEINESGHQKICF